MPFLQTQPELMVGSVFNPAELEPLRPNLDPAGVAGFGTPIWRDYFQMAQLLKQAKKFFKENKGRMESDERREYKSEMIDKGERALEVFLNNALWEDAQRLASPPGRPAQMPRMAPMREF